MHQRTVDLPRPMVLVPGGDRFEAQARRETKDHPGVPVDPDEIVDDLNARSHGVAAVVDRRRGKDPHLVVHTATYAVDLYANAYKGAYTSYTIGAVRALGIPEMQKVADQHLLLRPRGWQIVWNRRDIPAGTSAHVEQVLAEWDQLTETHPRSGVGSLRPHHIEFLGKLDRMIDAEREIALRQQASDPVPYRAFRSVGEQRHGAHSVYGFELAGEEFPSPGSYVQVRGEPGQRGKVTRLTGRSIIVHFHRPVDVDRLAPQGELELSPSSAVFRAQRDAVELLRTGRARNAFLLDVVIDGKVRGLRSGPDDPGEELDDDQLDAFRKAVSVEDLLVVRGPPGTGKTRGIRQIAEACANKGQRVLVTAHTHRAVDNVIAELPSSVECVRVGAAENVTEDGRPYLLDERIDRLGEEVRAAASGQLAIYARLDEAGQWAAHLGTQIHGLGKLLAREAEARRQLQVAEHAAAAPGKVRVEEAEAGLRRRERELAVQEQEAGRAAARADAAGRRTGWPLFGAWFRIRERRYRRDAVAGTGATDQLRALVEEAESVLAQARARWESEIRNDPSVVAAQSALAQVVTDRDSCRDGVVRAARAARDLVLEIEYPPLVPPDGTDAPAVHLDVGAFHLWLEGRLPMFAARKALLAGWCDEVARSADHIRPELLRYADVIAATCIGSATNEELRDLDFDLALVDEAGQVGITTALIPLTRARRGVLVGDDMQLPPFLDTEVEAWGASVEDSEIRTLLAESAFELLAGKLPRSHVVMLRKQRRMAGVIADFVSRQFYGGELVTVGERPHRSSLFTSPMAFVDTSGLTGEQRSERPGSADERWGLVGYTNDAEARLLVDLAVHYHRSGQDWAVIVPYRAQVARIRQRLGPRIGDAGYVRLNVGTVDSFQGGERDVLLFGFTRSNRRRQVGFLSELRRSNVAFSRAKRQLVLVGDLGTLVEARDARFRHLARALRDHVAAHGGTCRYGDIATKLARLEGAVRDGA